MKTLVIKNLLPIGTFILAVSGAFLTTSMQSVSKGTDGLVPGYPADANGNCKNVPSTNCDDIPDQFCYVASTGEQAFENQANKCIVPLYKRN